MGQGQRGNQPCWCGSGIKYKKCHKDRAAEAPTKWWDAQAQLREAFSQKKCSAPAQWSDQCEGKIVKAHTVSRSSSLSKISRDGHVYGFVGSLEELNKNDGLILPQLIGVGKASTFTGFCSKHDNQIFRPLEVEEFSSSAEQCFLAGYRAVARELFTKEGAVQSLPMRRDLDKGREVEFQQALQRFNDLVSRGTSAGYRDVRNVKQNYDEMLSGQTFEGSYAYVVKLTHVPPIMCSGGWLPVYDFTGRKLQNLSDLETPAKMMTCTSLGASKAGFVVFQWLQDSDVLCQKFIKALHAIPDHRIPAVLTHFIFGRFENLFMNPDWWESLSDATRKTLQLRFADAMNTSAPIRKYADDADGIIVPAWDVVDRVTVGFEL